MKRGLNIDPVCPLCLDGIEYAKHFSKDCIIVNKVWEAADKRQWLPFNVSPVGCQDLSQSLGSIQSSHNSKLKQKFSFLL